LAVLESLASSNAAIVRLLRRRDGGVDPFAEGDDDGDDGGSLLLRGAPGSASLGRFYEAVVRQGDKVSALVLDNARLALGDVPPDQVPKLRRYLSVLVAFGNLRSVAFSAFLLADVADALNTQQWAYARALANLGVAAHEQCVLDGGTSWDVAWLVTSLAEPPWSAICRTPQASMLKPFSRLLCASWVSAVVAYLKEIATLEERRRSTGKPKKEPRAKKEPPAQKKQGPKAAPKDPPPKGGVHVGNE